MTDGRQQGGSANSQAAAPPTMQLPSRLIANLYLLFGVAVLLLAGRSETNTLTRYAVGIAVELGLAAAALVAIRLEGLSIRDTARLRRAEPRLLVLALGAVPGLWITGVALNLLSRFVLGYSTPATPAQFPRTALEALALAITTMVVAPFCEEVMFRGYVQRAYERGAVSERRSAAERRSASERHHAWTGVVVGGIIFALYHLRFQGLFSLVPVALALGLVAWRTKSIAPAILMHAAFNAIATLILIATSFWPMRAVAALISGLVAAAALMTPLSFAALWLIWKTTPTASPQDIAPAPRPARHRAWLIPLLALLAIFAYIAGTELRVHRHPEDVLNDRVELSEPGRWQYPMRWHYLIQDRLGTEVGEAVCRQQPEADTLVLSCWAQHDLVDLPKQVPGLQDGSWEEVLERLPFGLSGLSPMLHAEATTWTMTATWSRASLELLDITQEQTVSGLPYATLRYAATETIAAPSTTGHEWQWRFSALPFRLPYGASITTLQRNSSGVPRTFAGFLHIQGAEPIWTPSGNYVTWRVSLSWDEVCSPETAGCEDFRSRRVQTAWYDVQDPHALVRFDDGAVSYILVAAEETRP